MMERVNQAVILCGGLGTRLGHLTAETPKPLLAIAGRPFLSILIEEIARQGVDRFLLLASFEAEQIRRFAHALPSQLGRRITIDVLEEPERAGTAGALCYAGPHLDPAFFLFNGDSWFDIPLRELRGALTAAPQQIGTLALRELPDAGRYGTVKLDGNVIRSFTAAGEGRIGRVHVNAGVYLFRREIVDALPRVGSLEYDVLPDLAAARALRGVAGSGYFIDIGIPSDYVRAQTEIAEKRCKPALFLDRDGVINIDHGHVGTIDRFAFVDGALEMIATANKAGFYVFVVTNQAGIGKGLYTLDDYHRLTLHIRAELASVGAHIDDERFCPDHPDAVLPDFRRSSDWRKPQPGMLLDLLMCWPIEKSRSFLIGDKPSDMEAATAAGLDGYLFSGGRVDEFVTPLLAPPALKNG